MAILSTPEVPNTKHNSDWHSKPLHAYSEHLYELEFIFCCKQRATEATINLHTREVLALI